MPRNPLPAQAVAISMVDCINTGDIARIERLLADDYYLSVFGAPPEHGRESGIAGWRGYLSGFPNYVVFPEAIVTTGDTTAMLCRTTGHISGFPMKRSCASRSSSWRKRQMADSPPGR